MRNTGKPSEHEFERYLNSLGKRVFFYRFPDAAEIRGRTGAVGQARPVPSDYLVTHDGKTFYAEVKSTESDARFAFALLRTVQSAVAKQVLAAGGDYFVYIHALAHNRWYKVPYWLIANTKDAGKKSLTWEELETCRETFES